MVKYKYSPGDLIESWTGEKVIILETKEFIRTAATLPYGRYKLLWLFNNSISWIDSREFEKTSFKVA